MTPTEESRLLSAVLKRVESGHKPGANARWLSIAGWLLLVGAFVALFQLAPRLGSIAVASVGAFLGVLSSFLTIHKHSLKQWPVLAPFIKVDEVKRRIDELKPNKSLERTRDR